MNTQDYLTDAQGRLVPISTIRQEDQLEDIVVNELIKQAVDVHKIIETFKNHAFSEVRTFITMLSEKYQISRGGNKGGVTLTSFDGTRKVQISVQDYISFGPQLQIAKNLIDECIKEWGADNANKNNQALVEHAFRVDKNNRINVQNILGLKRIAIRDEKWVRAMGAIDDSIRVETSKQFIRFYRRLDTNAEWEAVTLDIAKA